ncbi:hypothetical protein AB1Y20_008909 [Prymnesium parvum]|uniref:Uncharacterized protein n=1 Tax=Prymnesium parvum TaxID=97485 RepID=A0AB34JYV1_PRYPA
MWCGAVQAVWRYVVWGCSSSVEVCGVGLFSVEVCGVGLFSVEVCGVGLFNVVWGCSSSVEVCGVGLFKQCGGMWCGAVQAVWRYVVCGCSSSVEVCGVGLFSVEVCGVGLFKQCGGMWCGAVQAVWRYVVWGYAVWRYVVWGCSSSVEVCGVGLFSVEVCGVGLFKQCGGMWCGAVQAVWSDAHTFGTPPQSARGRRRYGTSAEASGLSAAASPSSAGSESSRAERPSRLPVRRVSLCGGEGKLPSGEQPVCAIADGLGKEGRRGARGARAEEWEGGSDARGCAYDEAASFKTARIGMSAVEDWAVTHDAMAPWGQLLAHLTELA